MAIPHLEELKVEENEGDPRRGEKKTGGNGGVDDFIIFREQTLVQREKGILLKKISQIAASIAVRRYPNKISLVVETRSLLNETISPLLQKKKKRRWKRKWKSKIPFLLFSFFNQKTRSNLGNRWPVIQRPR